MKDQPPSRTPPALRRRLDRLARSAHAFHRFAHHPLCREYAQERLQFGKVHVCRGCAALAAGILAGAAAGLALNPTWPLGLASILGALGLAGAAFRWRMGKLWGRFFPGLGWALGLVMGLRLGPGGWGMALGSALASHAVFIHYRRRGPHRGPCDTCPDRDLRPSCRGFAPILRRERAFQRLSGRWIAESHLPRVTSAPDPNPQL